MVYLHLLVVISALFAAKLSDSAAIEKKATISLSVAQDSCPNGLKDNLRNTTAMCCDMIMIQQGDGMMMADGQNISVVSMNDNNSTEDEPISAARKRRDDDSDEVTISNPMDNMMNTSNHSDEVDAPIVVCAVEALRMQYSVIEAIIEYCNSSYAEMTESIAANTTEMTEMANVESEPNGKDDVMLKSSQDDKMMQMAAQQQRKMNLMHMSSCMNEKIRMICPDLDIYALIHM